MKTLTANELEILQIDVAGVFSDLDEATQAKIVNFVADDRNIRATVFYDLIRGLNANICEMDGRLMRVELETRKE